MKAKWILPIIIAILLFLGFYSTYQDQEEETVIPSKSLEGKQFDPTFTALLPLYSTDITFTLRSGKEIHFTANTVESMSKDEIRDLSLLFCLCSRIPSVELVWTLAEKLLPQRLIDEQNPIESKSKPEPHKSLDKLQKS